MHKERMNRLTFEPGRISRVMNWDGFLFILILSVILGLSSQALSADAQPVDSQLELAAVQDNQSGDQLSQTILFLGRFHMVVLHLPIGLIVTLILLELYILVRSAKQLMPAVWIVLSLACVSAITAATFGTFLSWSGEYDPELIFWHKWLGISTAVLAAGVTLAQRRSSRSRGWTSAYLTIFVVLMISLTLGGHKGGQLTHGKNFLTEYAPWTKQKPARKSPARSSSGTTSEIDQNSKFATRIEPIQAKHCYQCHGAEKRKGKLRLDSPDAIRQGSENGLVVIPGKPEKSSLYTLTTLPKD
ncbi:MAG: hypothetical protein IID32_05075, partial [Planctomycetes bacterium]|nr:hypothetical protein [Planctomycetota bacterium]